MKLIFDLDGVVIGTYENILKDLTKGNDIKIKKFLSTEKAKDLLKNKDVSIPTLVLSLLRKSANKEYIDYYEKNNPPLIYDDFIKTGGFEAFSNDDVYINTKIMTKKEFAAKVNFLTKDCQIDMKRITFVPINETKKIDFCDVYVEDDFDNLKENYDKFDVGILFNRSYNIHYDLSKFPKIVRINTFDDLVNLLDRLKKFS